MLETLEHNVEIFGSRTCESRVFPNQENINIYIHFITLTTYIFFLVHTSFQVPTQYKQSTFLLVSTPFEPSITHCRVCSQSATNGTFTATGFFNTQWKDPGVSLLRLLFNVDRKTPQIWLMLHTNVDEFGSQNDLCPILSKDGNGCLQRSPILCVDRFEEGTLVTLISR